MSSVPDLDTGVLQWLVNGLMGSVMFLLNRSYTTDQAVMKERITAVEALHAADKKQAADKSERDMANLEGRMNSKIEDVLERVEDKLDGIASDTKQIGEKLSGAVTDIAWLKGDKPK